MSRPLVQIDEQRNADGATGVLIKGAPRLPAGLSTIPRISGPTFVGREGCLQAIEDKLRSHSEVVLCGPPGVGKSRILTEYAKRHERDYPGGRFFIDFEGGTPPHDLERLLRAFGLHAHEGEPFEERCHRALQMIVAARREHGPALVLCDAVPDLEVLREWCPPSASEVQVLAATTHMAAMDGAPAVEVSLLSVQDAEKLADEIFRGHTGLERLKSELVARSGGVTVELCASAQSARQVMRHGRKPKLESLLAAQDTTSSYGLAWRLLPEDTRLLLKVACTYVSREVPMELLRNALASQGWSADKVDENVDASRDRGMATGFADEFRIHQLTAKFVRGASDVSCEHLRPALWKEFARVANAFVETPGSLSLREQLLAHSADVSDWADHVSDWHAVGVAFSEAGRFADAQPWFERAVKNAALGDASGNIDHDSLSHSLHRIGYCLRQQGRFADAQPWFERAVAEAALGDVCGRVDHDSLASSLYQIGFCLRGQGRFAESQPWFERAVSEAELGDVHGHVDHESVGACQHQVGYALRSQDKFAEAQPWFERAVAQRSQGDVRGRIDRNSVGVSMHMVGVCLLNLGEFAEAQRWTEHAVAEKEHGDVFGRFDHESIANSLHNVGLCLMGVDKFADARGWFERAIEQKQLGDVHGRVDHTSLGGSLRDVGACLVSLGELEKAQMWFERAVSESEQGDAYGRVSHESIGRNLHQVGQCLMNQSKLAEAQPWLERAVKEKAQGDANGRVDSASLGISVRLVGDCLSRQGRLAEAQPWLEYLSRLALAEAGGPRV